jgi:hypothetical protein
MSDDPKLSQRYRELPREEPPRALDDKILAASRRAVESRPAPLVAPTGRRRWYFPVAAAAVITLAVAVTLHVQHDRPSEEVDAVSPSMRVQEVPKAEAPRQAPAPAREARRDAAGPGFAPDPKPAAESELAAAEKRSSADVQRAPAPQASLPAPAAAPAEAPRAAGARSEAGRMMARVESPEQALERIARLREAGRHEEADKALAEFHKRYPDYRLSDETKAKIEKR